MSQTRPVTHFPQYVDLTLDKPYRFRFTIFDARDACRMLNLLPGYAAQGPVNAGTLRVLLAGRDFDAYAAVLAAGLKHQDQRITHEKALGLLSDYLAAGGDLLPVALAIKQAAVASGVWEPDRQQGEPDAGNSDGSSPGS